MVNSTSPGKIPTPFDELPTGNEGLLHIAHWGNSSSNKNTNKIILFTINIIEISLNYFYTH